MHYDHQAIMDAGEDIGEGWKKAVITLAEGDSAYSGVSSKWDYSGPGVVVYRMHPSGWEISPSDGAGRRYL
ncbi:hypothetical protein PXH69_21930 [Rhodococcus qingshengii]|uniref:Uncharacterized protein n=1 Tax=Rhodococcus qingshengii TaxID=334542 RepID=A0AAW6LLM7_RHOSG|nr:hypothetical protein [Rhodococcus qingshengii]MDE8647639.1 hypothetical protein [Rhodococcus qingshengii]